MPSGKYCPRSREDTDRTVGSAPGRSEIVADFQIATGRLLVFEGATVYEDIGPPDSWLAFESLSTDSRWGTRPTSADLVTFPERYVAAHARLNAEVAVTARRGRSPPSTLRFNAPFLCQRRH